MPMPVAKWGWQYVFPAKSRSVDPRTGAERRHHLDESSLQKAVRAAARLDSIDKHVTCHTFRHSLPRTCSKPGMIFGPYRNYSGTRM